MKSLLTFFRLSPSWGIVLLLLCLFSPAHAGHWGPPTYVWSGSKETKELYYQQSDDPQAGPIYNTAIQKRRVVMNDGSPNASATGLPNEAHVRWGHLNGIFQGDGVEFSSSTFPKSATSYTHSSVYAILKWQRDPHPETGEPDPNDDPPTFIYVRQSASLFGYRGTFANGGVLSAYENTNWPGDFIKVTGNAQSKDLSTSLHAANWQYVRRSQEDGTGYAYNISENDVEIRRCAVVGDTANVPSVTFNATVTLEPGYQLPTDNAQGLGEVKFSYQVTPVDFGITPGVSHWWYNEGAPLTPRDPANIEINAFAGKEWIQTPVDQPLEYRWRAGLSPLVTATIGQNPASPAFGDEQNYKWSHAGTGITVRAPEAGATQQEINEQTLPPSTAQKHLRLDLGGAQEEWSDTWPKSSTARVGVTGGIGASTIPAKVKVNWHIPYSTTFALHVRVQVHMPDGSVVDLGTLGEDDLVDDLGNDWRDAMMVDRMRRGTPAMFGATGKTVGRVTIEGVVVGALALSSGGTSQIVRAPLTSEVSRQFIQKIAPWIAAMWAAHQANQLLEGKAPGILEVITTVVKVGTNGTSNVPVASDGTITASLNPSIPTIDIPPGLPLRVPNPGEVEDAANEDALRQLREGNAFDWPGKPGPPPLEPAPTPPPPNKIIDWIKLALSNAQPQPLQQPNGTLTQTHTYRGDLYYYTQDNSQLGDEWPGGSNTAWEPGFYYTTLRPSQAGALTRGAASFCLYGHPYVWDNGLPVFGQKVRLSQQDLAGLVSQNGDFDTRVPRGIFYSSTFVGQKDGAPEPISFQPGTPGAADVPFGQGIPVDGNNGNWLGFRGNSIWRSTDSRIINDLYPNPAQRPTHIDVPFVNGYPEFQTWLAHPQAWTPGIVSFSPIFTGINNTDFANANRTVSGTQSAAAGALVLTSNVPRLTWHHYEDMRTVMMVPTSLNSFISHQGGASHARAARR